MEEIWKSIEGYEGLYEVSNLGRVWSVRLQRILKLKNERDGYIRICLTKDGVEKIYQVHRLVAKAFIPNPDNLPCVNHKDEIKDNNIVTNLEWCSHSYNNTYGSRLQKCRETKIKHGVITGLDSATYNKLYYHKNKEKIRSYQKMWNELHPGKMAEYSRLSRARKKERIRKKEIV